MTLNGSNQMSMRDPMNTMHTSRREKGVWDTDNGMYWTSGVACAKALGVSVHSVYQACHDGHKTCKGRHLSYEENVNKTQAQMAHRLSKMSDYGELKKKAALWDAHEKKQEKERKAKEKHDAKIAKAIKDFEHSKRMEQGAIARRQKAEQRLNALKGMNPYDNN